MDYHLERGGVQLHDALGVNCKGGVTTENQGSGADIWATGCVFHDWARVIRLDKGDFTPP